MFTRDEFIIHVYCLLVQYFEQVFPTRLRQAGFDPALSDEEALTIELVGNTWGWRVTRRSIAIFDTTIASGFQPCRIAVPWYGSGRICGG